MPIQQPYQADHDTGKPPVQGARRKGRDRQRFDMLVKGIVVMLEAFVMRQVPRPRPVEKGAHQAGAFVRTTHAAGRLNVFGGVFGLARHHHQPEPVDVHAH